MRANGIAALAINRCVHFSALWADIEPLTEQGLVALACTPSHAWVTPAGGSRPLFGTNPIAFGWPRADRPPFLFDMATSAAARGEIELHRRAGTPLPEGWGIDKAGNPSTDAASVLEGAMLTFGGHKGSALAAMVELLAGPLIGDMTSKESLAYDDGTGSSPYGGELIIALDPERFLGADKAKYFAGAEAMFADMQAQGARIPGERRYRQRRQSEQYGVEIPGRCTTKSWRCAISAGLMPRAGNPARERLILPEPDRCAGACATPVWCPSGQSVSPLYPAAPDATYLLATGSVPFLATLGGSV